MPAALDGTRIVFAHEFRKQIGGKGFLIATLAIPVLAPPHLDCNSGN